MALTPDHLKKTDVDRNEMIALLRFDIVNETDHMHFYLLNASTVTGIQRMFLRPWLLEEAASEMKHVSAFMDKLVALEAAEAIPHPFSEPHLYSDSTSIVREAIRLESEVVQNYVLRISQCDSLAEREDDPFWTHLGLFFEEQIEHSHKDLDELRQIDMGL